MVILVDNQTPEKEKKYVYLTIFNLNFNMRNVLWRNKQKYGSDLYTIKE
jgi:hypothetical protein